MIQFLHMLKMHVKLEI